MVVAAAQFTFYPCNAFRQRALVSMEDYLKPGDYIGDDYCATYLARKSPGNKEIAMEKNSATALTDNNFDSRGSSAGEERHV